MTGPPLRRLDFRGLCAIHRELVARYGGGSAEVNEGVLHGAIMRAELMMRDPHWKQRARLAAAYPWWLLKGRPFAEGNARLALAAMVVFLEMNRMTWECGEVEETAMIQAAAAGQIKEKDWEAWVVEHIKKEIPAPKGNGGKK